MKNVCFIFKIHQPFRLKRYRFFDIGNDHYYYDDFANDDIVTRIAQQSYMPMANTLLGMVKEQNFRCALDISGTALEQLQLYVPEFNDLLKKLADTGKVEFLSGTYSHGISSLEDPEEFVRQVKLHDEVIKRTYGVTPKVICNTELIFDDDIALQMYAMGFKGCITEGAKHILGWKSPNYVYSSATAPKLKLLLVNDKMSRNISRNFNNTEWSDYPLTADKYIRWISEMPEEEQILNLYFSMDTFGTFIPASSGIFDFMKALPRFAEESGVTFCTPSEVISKMKPVGELSIPYPLSGVDESRDVSAWKGNDMQREALSKLYAVAERVNLCNDRRLKQDWLYLQSSDHFFYMSTKNLADGVAHSSFSPYDSPFSAFTNYMNVLADFLVRVEEQFPEEIGNEELNSLLLTIRNQASEINQLNKEVANLRTNILNSDDSNNAPRKPAKKTGKTTTSKTEKATRVEKAAKSAKTTPPKASKTVKTAKTAKK